MKKFFKNQRAEFLYMGIVLVGIISLGFFTQSCYKEEFDDLTDDGFVKNPHCDFKNPYDYVGTYHNEGLFYVLNNMDSPIKLKSDDNSKIEINARNLTLQFWKENPLGQNFSEEEFESSIQSAKMIRLKSSQNQFSTTHNDYFDKFKTLVKYPKQCVSIADVYNEIRIIEKEIYESDMSFSDKELLLITYAVGKSSLDFWMGCDKKTSTPRLKSGNYGETGEPFLDWWNRNVTPAVSAIVEVDFYGAAAGALQGLVAGATGGTVVLPGVGSITGAITGAVAGGAGGAVYSSVIGGVAYYYTVSR